MLGGLSGVERSTAARANAAGSYGSRGVANGGDGSSSRDTDTPAVAVQDGTTPTQRVVAARLDELPAAVEAAQLRSPTLVVIGSVVALYDAQAAAAAAQAAAAAAAQEGGAWHAADLLATVARPPAGEALEERPTWRA